MTKLDIEMYMESNLQDRNFKDNVSAYKMGYIEALYNAKKIDEKTYLEIEKEIVNDENNNIK